MSDTTNTGKELERWIAEAYRQIGARLVKHDVNLAGNQIDVYVELETPGHFLHRVAVEAKDWKSPVGLEVVNKFATILNLLHHERLVDEGAIISANGFTRPAREAAQTYRIRLLELGDVEAMVRQVAEAGMNKIMELDRILATLPEGELSRLRRELPCDTWQSIADAVWQRFTEQAQGQVGVGCLWEPRSGRFTRNRLGELEFRRTFTLDRVSSSVVFLALVSDSIPQLVDFGKKLRPDIHWPEVVSE